MPTSRATLAACIPSSNKAIACRRRRSNSAADPLGRIEKSLSLVTTGIIGTTGQVTLAIQAAIEYSRAGAKNAHGQSIPCQQALDTALANLDAAIAESHAQITRDDLPTVTAEPTQLAQLFQNLIGNAIKFGRSDVAPAIHVGCRREGEGWLFSVQDNGIGIDAQYQDKIFMIFQRLHGREKYAGTGIGLAICKKIAEQHGGKIWVESAAGEGSTFYFTIPSGGE